MTALRSIVRSKPRPRRDDNPALQVPFPLVVTERWLEDFSRDGADEEPSAPEERG
jgi:hypothetical protein